MRYIICSLLLVLSFLAHAAELQPGQVWSYRNRAGETASTLTVLKVETYKDLGRVVHIRIDGIHMKNPLRGNVLSDIPHLPFKERAVQQSVTEIVRRLSTVPEFQDGYDTWKKAYVAGQAGAFDMSVSATLDAMLGAEWQEKN